MEFKFGIIEHIYILPSQLYLTSQNNFRVFLSSVMIRKFVKVIFFKEKIDLVWWFIEKSDSHTFLKEFSIN